MKTCKNNKDVQEIVRRFELIAVEPPPSWIASSGRWRWPLPKESIFSGCCTEVVTASREWWEYAPSEAKPHPMAEGALLRDGKWYWAIPAELMKTCKGCAVRRLGDYDVWYKKCENCGFDTGKSRKLDDPRCWKCGRLIKRDYSTRALKSS